MKKSTINDFISKHLELERYNNSNKKKTTMNLKTDEILNALKAMRAEILATKKRELNDPEIPLFRSKFLSALIDAALQIESDYKYYGGPKNMLPKAPEKSYQVQLFGE